MEKDIIGEVRRFVESECKKESNKYGFEPFINHFVPTTSLSKKFAEELNLDSEVIEIAAWLHDIGSIIHGRKDHHITGMQIAEEKLKGLNYPFEKIEKIKRMIFSHRGSKDIKPASVEEQILIDADAINDFDHIEGLFKAAYDENLNQEQARKSVRQKMINSYNKISAERKQLVKEKFNAVMLLLNEDFIGE